MKLAIDGPWKASLEISYKDEHGNDHPGKATLEIERDDSRYLVTNDMTVVDDGYDIFSQDKKTCTKFIQGMAVAFKMIGADYSEVGLRK